MTKEDKIIHQVRAGQRLRRMRRLADKTQEEVGAVVGVGKAQISRIENGQGSLTREQRAAIAQFLGCLSSELEEGEETEAECACSQVPKSVVEYVRRATPEGIERLCTLVEALRPNMADHPDEQGMEKAA